MIPPRQQWCLMVDVTNACHLHCSNCTRLLDHARQRYFMDMVCFEEAIKALAAFPHESEPAQEGRRKMLGMIGGEPLLHPQFPQLVDAFVEHVPNVAHRGLWTSLDWASYVHPVYGRALPHVLALIGDHRGLLDGEDTTPHNGRGWLNWNMHLRTMRVEHAPILVASRDAVPDRAKRWQLIEDCWLQQKWSSTITPRGYFFCEVAGHMDMIFNGRPDGVQRLPALQGLPIEPGCWDGELYFEDEDGVRQPRGLYAQQVLAACQQCGMCLPLRARADSDEIDDVSSSNLALLRDAGSPRIRRGSYQLHAYGPEGLDTTQGRSNPRVYVKGAKPADQGAAARQEAE